MSDKKPRSPRLQQILDTAVRIAKKDRSEIVTSAHLLKAILSIDGGYARLILKKHGVTMASVKAAVKKLHLA